MVVSEVWQCFQVISKFKKEGSWSSSSGDEVCNIPYDTLDQNYRNVQMVEQLYIGGM